jgi:hypothetical protein
MSFSKTKTGPVRATAEAIRLDLLHDVGIDSYGRPLNDDGSERATTDETEPSPFQVRCRRVFDAARDLINNTVRLETAAAEIQVYGHIARGETDVTGDSQSSVTVVWKAAVGSPVEPGEGQ